MTQPRTRRAKPQRVTQEASAERVTRAQLARCPHDLMLCYARVPGCGAQRTHDLRRRYLVGDATKDERDAFAILFRL